MERRLSQKVNGRYVEQIFMFHKNGRRLQDGRGERPAPGRPELLAKKGRIVGGVGCPPNCRTSGNLRGSSGKLLGSSGEAPTLSNFLEKCGILEKS